MIVLFPINLVAALHRMHNTINSSLVLKTVVGGSPMASCDTVNHRHERIVSGVEPILVELVRRCRIKCGLPHAHTFH